MRHALALSCALPLLGLLPLAATAADAGDGTGWTGSGELGLAVARGNARSDTFNTKLNLVNEDDRWKHSFSLAALRARGEVSGDFDGDGVAEERFETNANRYEFAASSAIKSSERSFWVAALRYENDDFAPFDHQTTFSLGYGYTAIDDERTLLSIEAGPGYRRAQLAGSGETATDAIARGQVDFRYKLTDNTTLGNLLLVESGSDNTFLQNELGVTVNMNASFALKAGLQLRHNSEVSPGIDKTDTLTTVNLVYTLK